MISKMPHQRQETLSVFIFPYKKYLTITGDNFDGMLSNSFPQIDFFKEKYYCYTYDMNMPFFVRPQNGTINHQLYENLKYVDKVPWRSVPDLHLIPDGAVTFYEASPTNLTFKVQINDVRVDYRR